MRVLLVEDDPSVSEYVQQGLRELGHACDRFVTGVAMDTSQHGN